MRINIVIICINSYNAYVSLSHSRRVVVDVGWKGRPSPNISLSLSLAKGRKIFTFEIGEKPGRTLELDWVSTEKKHERANVVELYSSQRMLNRNALIFSFHNFKKKNSTLPFWQQRENTRHMKKGAKDSFCSAREQRGKKFLKLSKMNVRFQLDSRLCLLLVVWHASNLRQNLQKQLNFSVGEKIGIAMKWRKNKIQAEISFVLFAFAEDLCRHLFPHSKDLTFFSPLPWIFCRVL